MGRYQLVRKLATGGMAEVFLAKSSGPFGFEKDLVVKRILPHLVEDPQFVEMFLAEAKLAARLNHTNIVQIFDFGMEDGAFFIAMEFVDGVDLRTLKLRSLQQGTPIDFPLCARLIALACEGLAYAHELADPETGQPLKLIHRDISPDNIFVSKIGALKILDFGIAKAATAGKRTQSGVLKGKLPYMAPEYLLGEAIDARIDVYALGIVLFEMLVGHRPYRNDNEVRLIRMVLEDPLPDIRDFRPGVPEQLVRILSRALAKERDQRYRSCREFHADLERFLYLYSDPVGASQIARLIQELGSVPPPGSSSDALPTTPEPRLLFEASMKAPDPATTQRLRGPVPLAQANITDVESKKTTAPLTTLPVLPPGLSEPTTTPLPAPFIDEAPATPPQEAKPLAPAKSAVRFTVPEDALEFDPRTPWVRWTARWWLPGSLLLIVGLAFIIARREPPPALPESLGTSVAVPASAHVEETLQHPPEPTAPAQQPEAPLTVPTSEAADSPLQANAPARPPEATATIRVMSNLPAEVRIDGIKAGKTPLKKSLASGKIRLSVHGIHQGNRFNKEQLYELRSGELHDFTFEFRQVKVTLRGRPDDFRVLSIDGRPLDGQKSVITYEGRHILQVENPVTKEQRTTSCTAFADNELCKFSAEE